MSKATQQHQESRINLHTFIGVSNGEYIFLENVFSHSPDFKGAVGHSLRIVTKEDYDERTSDEGYRERCDEIWRMMVADGSTDESLDEFAERVKNTDGDSAIFDDSWYDDHDTCVKHYNETLRARAAEEQGVSLEDAQVDDFELAVRCEAGGGGRIFCKDGVHGVKFKNFEYLNPEATEAIKLIGQYEKYTIAQEARRQARKSKK